MKLKPGFIPYSTELATKIGSVNALVAAGIWLKWRIQKRVCNAGTRELGRVLALNHTTVSKAIKWLVSEGWVEDLSPDRRGAPHDLVPSVDLINTLCNDSVDVVNTSEPSVDVVNTGVDVVNTGVDLINKEESLKESLKDSTTKGHHKKIANQILSVCNMEKTYLTDDAITDLRNTTRWMVERSATVEDFEFFVGSYWWGTTPPSFGQLKKYWANSMAQMRGKNGQYKNGHSKTAKPPTPQTLTPSEIEAQLAGL